MARVTRGILPAGNVTNPAFSAAVGRFDRTLPLLDGRAGLTLPGGIHIESGAFPASSGAAAG